MNAAACKVEWCVALAIESRDTCIVHTHHWLPDPPQSLTPDDDDDDDIDVNDDEDDDFDDEDDDDDDAGDHLDDEESND